jgi:LuxR family maltose regulon positive regulatory protein
MLLTTKLFTPRRQAPVVTRPRLIDQLNEGSSERLILVSGPAGFGKTTLVAQWLHHFGFGANPTNPKSEIRNLKFSWLSLDDQDNDPIRFLTYLVAALRGVEPGIGHNVERLLQTPQPPALADLITILLNEIAQVTTPFVLVLDDYHVIHTAAIHQALSFLVEHMPPAMHLVILTRADPPLPLARWRVRRLLTEIREQDLRFTADEVVAFLEQALDTQLSCADVTALTQRTEGWVAGLQLAALSMAGRSNLRTFIQDFTGSHAYIVDYLTEEVLQRQPATIQDFLLQTSILDRLDASLCAAVTGQENTQAILEQLERANLFLIPLDNGRRWYRYHHLFAEVLRRSLQQRHPALVARVHERASLWFEAHGLVGEAVQHALAAGNAERAAALIELGTDRLLKCGESVTLAGWIDRLPVDLFSARPRLGLARAKTYMLQHQVDAAERILQGWSLLSRQTMPRLTPQDS